MAHYFNLQTNCLGDESLERSIEMRSLLSRLLGITAVGLIWTAGLTAQIVWDAPSLMRPGAPPGLSVLLLEAHPSDELGVLAIWRNSAAPLGLGFRGGIGEDRSNELTAMFGFDVSGSLPGLGAGGGQPDVLWWTGAGLGVGDELVVSFPLGLVLGWSGSEEGLALMPYVGGHVSLDVITGPGDDLDLDASVDLGIDLGFRSGLMVRFGASVGGRDALAIGIRVPR